VSNRKHDKAGIVEDLYSTALDVFRSLWTGIRELSKISHAGFRNEFKSILESFVVWGDGFRNGRLEEALTHSEPLKLEIVKILSDIGELLDRGKP
jgi:hypothetical protein